MNRLSRPQTRSSSRRSCHFPGWWSGWNGAVLRPNRRTRRRCTTRPASTFQSVESTNCHSQQRGSNDRKWSMAAGIATVLSRSIGCQGATPSSPRPAARRPRHRSGDQAIGARGPSLRHAAAPNRHPSDAVTVWTTYGHREGRIRVPMPETLATSASQHRRRWRMDHTNTRPHSPSPHHQPPHLRQNSARRRRATGRADHVDGRGASWAFPASGSVALNSELRLIKSPDAPSACSTRRVACVLSPRRSLERHGPLPDQRPRADICRNARRLSTIVVGVHRDSYSWDLGLPRR